MNRRAEDLVKLQRKIAAYRQMQHDTTAQLYSVAVGAARARGPRRWTRRCASSTSSATTSIGCSSWPRDEVELLGRVRSDYEPFIGVVTRGRRADPRRQGRGRPRAAGRAGRRRWPSGSSG